jgi:hypothetical protein
MRPTFWGILVLACALACPAFAQVQKFTCDPPVGKRVESGGLGQSPNWADDSLPEIHPTVLIDGQTFSVTWGNTTADQKSGRPKATTYVFAAAHRDQTSILATRVDDTTAEIFRFYFSNKSLYKLSTSLAPATQDAKGAPPFVATYVAACREQ